MEKNNLNLHQKYIRTYPLKKHWQTTNTILGFWFWLVLIIEIIIYPLSLIFPWKRKVIPAFRKMMSGERRSCLRISDDGLEYIYWPFYKMQCNWDDVKSIKKGRLLGDRLYLERVEEIGDREFTINLQEPHIHLSSLVGWPNGGLEEDLRKYAPQLFDHQG